MTSLSVKVNGLFRAQNLLAAKLPQKANNAAAYALYNMGQDILSESYRLVPREFSTLIRSNFVEVPVMSGRGIIRTRAGYNTSYAVYVHEIPPPPQKSPKGRSARHKKPTQWKYLSTPFDLYMAKASKHFAHYVGIAMLTNKQWPKKPFNKSM